MGTARNFTTGSEYCDVRYWKAGGWHLHITYPDGVWEHRVFKDADYHKIDWYISDLRRAYGARLVVR